MKFRDEPEGCGKGKDSYFILPTINRWCMQRRSNSLDYMGALMLPAIGEGKLAHFEQSTDVGRGGERSFYGDLEWRDAGTGGPRSFPRPRGSPPTGRTHNSPHGQPPHRHSDPNPPGQHHHTTETTVTNLFPSRLVSSSSPSVTRRAYFHLRSDDTGERSASNQSLSDWRDTAVGELPRLTAAAPSRSHDSADSNARNSSGVFILPTTHPLRVDSPRDQRDELGVVSGGGRGSQWSPVSKDSVENSNSAAKVGPESDALEPTTSRLLQDLEATIGRGGQWTTRQRTGMKLETRPGQGNTRRTHERTSVGVTKVTPLTRMNQILSKSNTNLSKSEFLLPSVRRGNNTSSNLQRYCSEVNLVNRVTGNDGPRGPQHIPNTSAQRPAALATQPNRNLLIKSQSQPQFRPGVDRQRPLTNRKSYRDDKNEAKNGPEAEEKEKEERIIEWLLDIDGYAEPPDSPIIFDDEPLQSDTAIHVVYEGD